MAEIVKRTNIATFLDTTPSSSPTLSLLGMGITDYGQDYNANVTTEKYIIDDNATNTLDSYNISATASQTCYKGDAVYDFINNLRRNATVGDGAKSYVYDVDKYNFTGTGVSREFEATKYACTIAINSYAKGERPAIEYTIYYNGTPTLGTMQIDAQGVATFTPDTASL